MNSIMRDEFMDALEKVEKDHAARALLITGSGKAFCAGQDLNERRRAPEDPPPDLSKALLEDYNPIVRKIRGLAIPVIAGVNGVAAGAGANLAFACDIVIASKNAKFIQSFSNIGLVPDCGGTWSLARKIGQSRAVAWAMTGDSISAEQAQAWGLVWKCYHEDEFQEAVLSFTQGLAKKPTSALVAIKKIIETAYQNSFSEQLELEAKAQLECGLTADYAEGVQAFFQKRAPIFTGK